MTTNFGNFNDNVGGDGNTILSLANSFLVGCTYDAGLVAATKDLTTDETAHHLTTNEPACHNIGMGELVVTFNQQNRNSGIQSATRSYGKPLVVGQSGNLPHNIDMTDGVIQTIISDLGAETAQKMYSEQVLKQCTLVGASIDHNNTVPGPGQTPAQNGMAVIMSGPTTLMSLRTSEPLPIGVPLVLALSPENAIGRRARYQSDGPVRYPFTLKRHNPKTTVSIIHDNLKTMGKVISVKPDMLKRMNSLQPGNTDALLDSHKNAYNILLGLVGLATLIASDVSGSKADAVIADKDKMASIIAKITEPGKTDTIEQNALMFLLSGVQDVAASSNRVVARSIQTMMHGRSSMTQGAYNTDVWLY